jgi:hypothetical protein
VRWVAAGTLLLLTFLLGRLTAVPFRGVEQHIEVRRAAEGWIEVYRNGKLESEWGEHKDVELWGWLDKLLREDPSLYDPPAPRAAPPKAAAPTPDTSPSPETAPHGRGPTLFDQASVPLGGE